MKKINNDLVQKIPQKIYFIVSKLANYIVYINRVPV